jgi:uncharacterized protein YpmB
MKKAWISVIAGLLLILAVFTACGTAASRKSGMQDISQSVQPVAAAQNIDLEQAENTVKNTISLDYTKYTLNMINDKLMYQGQEFYQFLISDGNISLEPSVIVSKADGEIYCYYPDSLVTEVYQDSVFKSKCL